MNGSYKWLVLATVSIGNLLGALDVSIIYVSFPRLAEVFNTDASVVLWVTVAYSMGVLGLMMTLAKVGDSIGRKKVFLIGMLFYTLGLFLCSISPNIMMLIGSRIIQGAGGGILMSLGMAIGVSVFPVDQRGRALGIIGMAQSAGLVAGPALGGIILDALDWQAIFYTRIPLGIIGLIMTAVIIKEQKQEDLRFKLDLAGAITLLLGICCLVLYLNLGKSWGYLAGRTLILGGVAVISLGFFLFIETKAVQPVLDLGLFKNRGFTLVCYAAVMHFMVAGSAPFLAPFFMIDGLQFSPSTVGILMAFNAIPAVFLAPAAGWLSDKRGTKVPMLLGLSFLWLCLFSYSRLGVESSVLIVLIPMIFYGCGMGLFFTSSNSAVVMSTPEQNTASVMGVIGTLRILGQAIGVTVTGTLYASCISLRRAELVEQAIDPSIIDRLAVVDSFRFILFVLCIIFLSSILAVLLTGKQTKD